MCIGDRFSLMEKTLAIAMTAQRFHLRIDHELVPDPLFTLRPAGGISARLERRTVREGAGDAESVKLSLSR
jgi:cytochrome P450